MQLLYEWIKFNAEKSDHFYGRTFFLFKKMTVKELPVSLKKTHYLQEENQRRRLRSFFIIKLLGSVSYDLKNAERIFVVHCVYTPCICAMQPFQLNWAIECGSSGTDMPIY